MNDNDILAVEEAAARLESASRDRQNLERLHSAVATALTHGKTIRDIAHAAHLTALEVLDAADEITYPAPPSAPGIGTLNASPPPPPENPLPKTTPGRRRIRRRRQPRGLAQARDADRRWVSHRPSTETPARSYRLTYRASHDATAQE